LDEHTVSVHRLVQAVVRDQHRSQPGAEPAVPAGGWAGAAVELVAAIYPPDSDEVVSSITAVPKPMTLAGGLHLLPGHRPAGLPAPSSTYA
jgi:hypothetical protein